MRRILALAVMALTALGSIGSAQAQPLGLELTSSRYICTIGTLTKIQWTVLSGSGPCALAVDEQALQRSEGVIGAICAADQVTPDTETGPMTVLGYVVDADGNRARASVQTVVLPPLPAPWLYGVHLLAAESAPTLL